MPMSRNELLNATIDDGIYEITTIYTRPNQKIKREGGIAGFEACRGKSDEELLALLRQAKLNTRRVKDEEGVEQYWGAVMYERQIEWTLNVLSAAMHAHNMPPLIPPTALGLRKAIDVLGIQSLELT